VKKYYFRLSKDDAKGLRELPPVHNLTTSEAVTKGIRRFLRQYSAGEVSFPTSDDQNVLHDQLCVRLPGWMQGELDKIATSDTPKETIVRHIARGQLAELRSYKKPKETKTVQCAREYLRKSKAQETAVLQAVFS